MYTSTITTSATGTINPQLPIFKNPISVKLTLYVPNGLDIFYYL
jgi:hypothetical protein